ncbi:hypothetical protein ADUPG1_010855 [Aduncisulcus paluster]|uniref:Uncharacterized protein n=1 Tax=Aduncisulcus paluster TaxID=2918883 RepID=A0ABQ5JTA7_9EUKA|nr:hypothetical protein ADUPG1_010855 [Aduncisulcus paluster]
MEDSNRRVGDDTLSDSSDVNLSLRVINPHTSEGIRSTYELASLSYEGSVSYGTHKLKIHKYQRQKRQGTIIETLDLLFAKTAEFVSARCVSFHNDEIRDASQLMLESLQKCSPVSWLVERIHKDLEAKQLELRRKAKKKNRSLGLISGSKAVKSSSKRKEKEKEKEVTQISEYTETKKISTTNSTTFNGIKIHESGTMVFSVKEQGYALLETVLVTRLFSTVIFKICEKNMFFVPRLLCDLCKKTSDILTFSPPSNEYVGVHICLSGTVCPALYNCVKITTMGIIGDGLSHIDKKLILEALEWQQELLYVLCLIFTLAEREIPDFNMEQSLKFNPKYVETLKNIIQRRDGIHFCVKQVAIRAADKIGAKIKSLCKKIKKLHLSILPDLKLVVG